MRLIVGSSGPTMKVHWSSWQTPLCTTRSVLCWRNQYQQMMETLLSTTSGGAAAVNTYSRLAGSGKRSHSNNITCLVTQSVHQCHRDSSRSSSTRSVRNSTSGKWVVVVVVLRGSSFRHRCCRRRRRGCSSRSSSRTSHSNSGRGDGGSSGRSRRRSSSTICISSNISTGKICKVSLASLEA